MAEHLIAAGLGTDAIRNFYIGAATGNGNKGYYQMAALEAIASVGIEVKNYIEKKRAERLKESLNKIDGLTLKAKKQLKTIISEITEVNKDLQELT